MTAAHVRTEPTATERKALHTLWKMYREGDAQHGIVRNPTTAGLISAVQTADVGKHSHTDRARGVSTQVFQAAGELVALGTDANPAEVIARKRTLLRRLRTVEILQLKAQWFK